MLITCASKDKIMKVDPKIKQFLSQNKKDISRFLSAIKRYDKIAIFRHIMPDFDALGSQLGLATWLKDNFPTKEIRVLGDNHVTFTPRLYPEMDRLNEDWFKEPFLAIILDTANTSRISDPRYKKAKFKIKIDHHPEVEKFGKVQIVRPDTCAAAEIVSDILLLLKDKYILSKEAASYLYSGIAGDSGRFQYSSTSENSFITASYLVNAGIELSEIYNKMYQKKLDDLKVTAYILNHFSVSDNGIAYYVLDADIQKELNITTERGKENVNLFSNIEGINAWCSITEDPKDNCWRVSIRSKSKAINGVAAKWEGGGHAQASGAKLKDLKQLTSFIKDLDELFK